MPNAFVAPRVLFLTAVEMGPWPARTVDITFDHNMNIGLIPAAASFEVINFGIPYVPIAVVWQGLNRLRLSYGGGAGAGVAEVRQLVFDPNCRSVSGEMSWAPQSIPFNIT